MIVLNSGGTARSIRADNRPDESRPPTGVEPVIEAADAALGAALAEVDPVLLELCRLRIAQLLRATNELQRRDPIARDAGLDETTIAALSRYAESPLYGDRERSCIAFAEQMAADAPGIQDDEIQRIRRHLGDPGYVAFVYALTLIEGRMRIALALEAS
jgi:alkylhydroperoxidase family enzyme